MVANIGIKCFIRAYIFVLFPSVLCRSIGGDVIRQSFSVLHLFKFLLSFKFAAPLCVPPCTGMVGLDDQMELLRVRNFRGPNAGTADAPLDEISIRGIHCSSKGYMSWPWWPVPAQHSQALKKFKWIWYKHVCFCVCIVWKVPHHFDD